MMEPSRQAELRKGKRKWKMDPKGRRQAGGRESNQLELDARQA